MLFSAHHTIVGVQTSIRSLHGKNVYFNVASLISFVLSFQFGECHAQQDRCRESDLQLIRHVSKLLDKSMPDIAWSFLFNNISHLCEGATHFHHDFWACEG